MLKNTYAEWTILVSSLALLILFYGSDWRELMKALLQWSFAASSFLLIFEHGLKRLANGTYKS